MLLTPNTYLRIGENSSIRMVSDNLSDTRIELLAGSSAFDSEAAAQGSFVKLIFKDSTIRFVKPGRYRIDADPPQLRVFDGEAEVTRAGDPTDVVSEQLLALDGAPVVKRFTEGTDGLLDIWSAERHSMIASNLLNSQSISDPLTDPGSDGSTDYLSSLGAYGGYIPLAGLPSVMGGYYGYNTLAYGYGGYPNPYPLYGYTPYGFGVIQPYGYAAIRPTYSRVLSTYGLRTGTTSSLFTPRPTSGFTVVSRPVVIGTPRPAAVHVVGHVSGHR